LPLFGVAKPIEIKKAEQNLSDAFNAFKEEKKKGGGSGALMILNPFSTTLTEAEKNLLKALKGYVGARLKQGKYSVEQFFEQLKKNGIELTEATKKEWGKWFADVEKTAVKSGIEKETGVSKPKPSEQRRIDRAYGLGVADTVNKFQQALDNMISDFKEMMANKTQEDREAKQWVNEVKKDLRKAIRDSKLDFNERQVSKIAGIVGDVTINNFDKKVEELNDYLQSIEDAKSRNRKEVFD
jgi:5'-3' exonuclease